jgi:hypothetical protein
MSFGISVGDFIAVGQLAWRLYEDCYRIARGAPHEFRLLIDELKTLYMSMKLFENELNDPNSVLVKAGEERLQMVKDLLEKVKQVLKGLDDSFNKHRKLGDVTRKGLKAMWDQFQWARYAKDVDGLRNKVGVETSTSGRVGTLLNTECLALAFLPQRSPSFAPHLRWQVRAPGW